jgi:hypothetical protein
MNINFRDANGRSIYHPYIPLRFAYQQPIYTEQLFYTNQTNPGFNNYQTNQTNQPNQPNQPNQGFFNNYQQNTNNSNDSSGIPMEIDEEDKNKKTEVIEILDSDSDSESVKRDRIPLTMKRKVWEKYIGSKTGEQKCKICNIKDIYQMSFTCARVISKVNGGEATLENLRPICDSCQRSMYTTNMKTFYEKKLSGNIPFERLWK